MSIATVVSRGLIAGRMSAWVRRGFAAAVPVPEPPVGFNYIDADTSLGVPPLSAFNGAVPPVATGDIFILSALTDGGYATTPRADGTFSVDAGGDTSRQELTKDVYSFALGALYGQQLIVINDRPPQFTSADVVYAFLRNTTITPIDLPPLFADPEGQAVTVTAVSSADPFAVVAGQLTTPIATADEDRIDQLAIRGTDPDGQSSDGLLTLITGDVVVPPTKGSTSDGAEQLIEAGYLAWVLGDPIFSDVETGLIAGSNPDVNTRVAPFSTVVLYPSLGLIANPTSTAFGQQRKTRRSKRDDEDVEDRERLRTEVLQAAAAERASAAMRAEAEANAAKQIRVQTKLPNKFRGRR